MLATTATALLGRMATAATTPLLPADYLDLVAPLAGMPRPGAPLRGRVESIRRDTEEAATITIRTGRGWPGHRPGQYVRLGVDVAGVRHWRAYSITSGPRTDGRISVTVRAVPGGRVSEQLVRRTRPGTMVQLGRPAGDFVLPNPAPQRVLFVTAGSGITPVAGILRHQLPHLPDVVAVHCSTTASAAIFGAELRAAPLRFIEHHTDHHGPLRPSNLVRLVPDWAERQTWACGPPGMLADLVSHWASHGLPDRLHTERFRSVLRVDGQGGRVSFARAGRSAEADGATPLLEIGERAGVLMPHGCRMGICYGCVLPLASGRIRDLRSGALTDAEPGDQTTIQTCVSAAAGDCVLDI